jgi:uncharacterized protein YegL
LGAFVFRAAQAGSLPFAGATPFGCDVVEAADAVELVEACDDSEDEEFWRWALFLMNMGPPLGAPSALHVWRLMF